MTHTGADADYPFSRTFTGEETYLPVDYNKLDVVYGGASPLRLMVRWYCVYRSQGRKGGF